jgi:RND family efflux transporter MFP subunit
MNARFRILPCLAVAALGAGCSHRNADAPKPAAFVQTSKAFEGPAVPAFGATGIVTAKDEMRLSFKVGGVIRDLTVTAGDRVRQGQLLAQIDPAEIDAQVEQARQLADKAARDLARGEALHADQVIALEQLQNLRTQADVTRAQLRAVQFNRGHAAIVAPRNAIVLRRLAQPREFVPPGQPVLVLGAEDGGFVVRTGLSDRDVVRVKRGDAVDVRLDAWPESLLPAHLTEIAGAADERSGLFQVEARIEPAAESAQRLVTGMVARMTLRPAAGDVRKLVYVPVAAVLDADSGKAAVFVADHGVAHRHAVDVAFITADGVALRSGLAAGDEVVTAGAAWLDDGDAIRTP